MKINFTLFLLFILPFSNLQAQEEGFEFVNKPITIVVLGSSTAAGIGTWPRENAWVNRYREYVKVFNPNNEVINLGKGGFGTYKILPTDSIYTKNRPEPDTTLNFTKALQYKPNGIIINLPSNDVANGYSVAEQLANFRYLAQLSAANGIELWVTTTQSRNFPKDEDRQIQSDLKDSLIAIFPKNYIDFWSGFCDEDYRILKIYDSGDGCHINNDAHKILTDRVIESNAFERKLDRTAVLRSTKKEFGEEMPPYMLSVGFSGEIEKDSDFQKDITTVKIMQENRMLAQYLAKKNIYQIEAIVDMRTPVEIVFESNNSLTKTVECDFGNMMEFEEIEIENVYYPLASLDIKEIALDKFNYRFSHDKITIGQFDFDTTSMSLEYDAEFTTSQLQRIKDACIEPPKTGKKVVNLWENGNKKSVLKFKEGQLDGKSKWYGENGEKERIVSFENGSYDGKYIEFNSEGKKKSLRIFEKDEQVGETKRFD